MGNFDVVTSIIENTGRWNVLLSDMEDGYIIYTSDDYPGYELVFANWDVPGQPTQLRFVMSSHQGGQDGYGELACTDELGQMNEHGVNTIVMGLLEVLPDIVRNN